jgi:tyrosyl-tRNA synthetase
VDNNIVKSSSEARRLIASGSVKINSNIVEELDLEPSVIKNTVLQVGKRRNYRII